MNTFCKTTLLITSVALSLLSISGRLHAQDDEVVESADIESNTLGIVNKGKESLLDQQIADNEKVWLNAEGLQQLAYYLSDSSDNTYGGVLLIPELGRHPAARGMINDLRITLANNHWHTLTLNLSGATEQQAQQLITAGITYFNQQGVYNLAILGEGLGATQALQCVASLPVPPENSNEISQVRAVLMINGNNKVPGSDVSILKQLAAIKVPILDAYLSNNYKEKQQAAARKKMVRKTKGILYQQIRLPQVSGNKPGQDNRITKRIRGWLDNNAAGYMVKGR